MSGPIGRGVVAGAVVLGLLGAARAGAQATQAGSAALPSFEVVSIKPDRSDDGRMMFQNTPGKFTMTNTTIKFVIEFAYNIKDFQLSGGPSWISSDHYDINAKIEDSVSAALEKLPPDQRQEQVRLMFQSMLADRFNMKLERETKELPVFALVVAKGGPKLTQTADPPPAPAGDGPVGPPPGFGGGGGGGRGGGRGPGRTFMIGRGQINMNGAPLSALADALSRQADIARVVVDETGLRGDYDIALKWTPEGPVQLNGQDTNPAAGTAPLPDPSGVSIFTALQDQLGLKLESRKAPTETFVISHIDKPSEN
ncbi:MAG TPA: TIGR03435 family protein [Candidatus Acidoferrales bacterium]|nr:TIGR03435 family protein [Candidatus Acidoferrales bacterium]